jgi:hypothetical protein
MSGGRIAGTVNNCMLTGGSAAMPLTARLSGSFDCRFAP